MDHNEFEFLNDLINPFTDFLKRLNDDTTHFSFQDQLSLASTNMQELEKEGFITHYSDIDDSCVDY